MQTVGVICEYNPFHNGHLYHIRETRKNGATHIVAVMSGNFVQRGDVAIMDKLERAKPVLKVLPGWKTDIRGIKKYEDLPENCRKYIEFVEKELEVPIKIVSNGPSREDIILK